MRAMTTATPERKSTQARLWLRVATVEFVVLLGLAAVIWKAAEATTASRQAQRSYDTERAARLIAQQRASTSAAVLDFVQCMLVPTEPGTDPTLSEMLDRTTRTLDAGFVGRPMAEAEIRDMVRALYRRLGRDELALPHARHACELWRHELGLANEQTLRSMRQLARLRLALGEPEQAERLYREVLAIRRRTCGSRHDQTLWALNDLAMSIWKQGDLVEAETLLRELLQIMQQTGGEEAPGTLTAMSNLGLVLLDQDRLAEAEPFFRRTLAIGRRTYGLEHESAVKTLSSLAGLLCQRNQFGEAEHLYREALEISRRVKGLEHPGTWWLMSQLAGALSELAEYDAASRLHEAALQHRLRHQDLSSQDAREAIEQVMSFYEVWEKPKEVARWQAVLAAPEHGDNPPDR